MNKIYNSGSLTNVGETLYEWTNNNVDNFLIMENGFTSIQSYLKQSIPQNMLSVKS